MPRTGSRVLVLLGLFFAVAVAVAALAPRGEAPRLDPSPAPTVRLDEPSSGRLLGESEVREQLGAQWADARLSLVRFGDVAALATTEDPVVSPDRLVWLAVRRAGDAWALRVYDAASGIRLVDRAGTGTPPASGG